MPETTTFSEQPLPVATGPVVQSPVPAVVMGTAFANGAAVTNGTPVLSNLIIADGYEKIAAALKASVAGTFAILRYLDDAGTIPQTAFATQAVTANTQANINVNDGLPFASFKLQFTPSATGTITNVFCMLQAQ